MQFKYTAINKAGSNESDYIEATSYHDAVTQLHSKGLIPTEVVVRKESMIDSTLSKLSGVSLQDKIVFIQNLAIMLKAGISMTKALNILSKQTNNPKFKKILMEVYQDVEEGKSFADTLGKYPGTFNNIFISMVRVGEMSGNLDKSLEYLGIQLQREHALVSKVRGAMIYPSVIVFAVVVVGFLMAIFVLPTLLSVFKQSNVALPITTQIVIAVVDFLQAHTVLVIVGFFALIFGGMAIYRTQQGQRLFDKTLLYTPVFGDISKKINMARFSRIVSSMLKSGTPILEGLQVAADSLDNYEYKDAVGMTVQDVRVGKTMAQSLSKYPRQFNYLVTQMISVGEESGTLDAILEQIAVRYEAEVDDIMSNLSSVIEPVLILGIGSVVGVLALALIGPIYSITQQAGN